MKKPKEKDRSSFLRNGIIFGTHKTYVEGDHRPLLRGYLHGTCAIMVMTWWALQSNNIQHPATIPVLFAICWILLMSSLLHLVPWRYKKEEFIIERLDKCGIVALCVASALTPQLVVDTETCRATTIWVLLLQLVPLSMSATAIWWGDESPRVFLGVIWAGFMAAFHAVRVDASMLYYAMTTLALYGVGFYIYLKQFGGKQQRLWGYHEWMHVFVTMAFYVNYQGTVHFSEFCSNA
jgi:predicted membrane channel-forming protein YqfA (hemolysin III family)